MAGSGWSQKSNVIFLKSTIYEISAWISPYGSETYVMAARADVADANCNRILADPGICGWKIVESLRLS